MRYLILIAVILFSGCITIKHLPAPCKPDTVYIEKENPLLFKPMPYYPQQPPIITYPILKWPPDTLYLDIFNGDFLQADTILNILTLDTNKVWRGYPLVDRNCHIDSIITRTDTSYKKAAMKAQQMTNSKINIYENDGCWMESRIIDTCYKNKNQ